MSYLVIVESPAKANTIKSYLGSNYRVIASKGHIRDLPKSSLGIDVDDGFKPRYINIRGKGDVIKELRREAKAATKIFLATDPDREGEAISWHIADQLGIPEGALCRITFNEITKGAVKEAIKHPRAINLDLVNSQQARRILDRIVGFTLSELMWKRLKSGLSGGRVQSVAARIIAEREEEIRSFVPQEYWTVESTVYTSTGDLISAKLFGDSNGKIKISSEKEARAIEEQIASGVFEVKSVKHAIKHKAPLPPFTTSTLQQEASRRLGFQSQRIMKIAQELYDGLNLGNELGGVQGLITYMRTDSLRVSDAAAAAAAEFIKENYGEDCLPDAPRVYKSSANSQDAHEAIRPSNIALTPQAVKRLLSSEQYKLYKLIWERFIASQMASAVLDTVSVELVNNGYVFKTGGYVIKSLGYMSIYNDQSIENESQDSEDVNLLSLPQVRRGERLVTESVISQQHFTEAPPRYTEASLIKFLEENGIGRPSTYAPIISIITSREYVKRDGKALVATPLGELTTRFMKEYFPEIIDYEFTAEMEAKLDSIEQSKNTIVSVISDFYQKFMEEIKLASEDSRETERFSLPTETSGIICDKCGAEMVYKSGRYGKFLACPNFPKCRNTKALDEGGNVVESTPDLPELAGFKCEECGAEMVVRRGKYGAFYACSNYPECKFTKQKVVDIGVSCPICSSRIVGKRGRSKSLFYSCERYPECDFSTWDLPLAENCPDCGSMLFYKRTKKCVICKDPACGYVREQEMTVPQDE